ncbi:hypothetical protein CBM2586_B130599 [Cupriavidus phytorum]|uniref:Uncharacterized protein n=1 Tax=Cupriavidus taiwanensis TaxID=164546 RepID=A0A375CJE2_9BURK|nr:hypothetical protein CBM2586_B130599 [Cupriavidus taiwanensis]
MLSEWLYASSCVPKARTQGYAIRQYGPRERGYIYCEISTVMLVLERRPQAKSSSAERWTRPPYRRASQSFSQALRLPAGKM